MISQAHTTYQMPTRVRMGEKSFNICLYAMCFYSLQPKSSHRPTTYNYLFRTVFFSLLWNSSEFIWFVNIHQILKNVNTIAPQFLRSKELCVVFYYIFLHLLMCCSLLYTVSTFYNSKFLLILIQIHNKTNPINIMKKIVLWICEIKFQLRYNKIREKVWNCF